MNYLDRVRAVSLDIDTFYRAFFAPGVGHCGGGTGAIPIDPLMALRRWVEQGQAPEGLVARSQFSAATQAGGSTGTVVGVGAGGGSGTGGRTRMLCRYPLMSTYSGGGKELMGSWTCS